MADCHCVGCDEAIRNEDVMCLRCATDKARAWDAVAAKNNEIARLRGALCHMEQLSKRQNNVARNALTDMSDTSEE